ncbi:hypothetical protein ACFZAM_31490 [Streptomyces sp. NPDC008079]|uniref:hypothetical protein n=1 Tax=Streptomyces sp. NPDC008079 TaxID=3364806 RepID=UPI0036F14D60
MYDLFMVLAGIGLFLLVEDILARLRRAHRSRALKKSVRKSLSGNWCAGVLEPPAVVTPRKVSADRPPYFVTHVRAADDPPTVCTCHGRQLTEGEKVLYWPTSDASRPDGDELLCRDSYERWGHL